jgi:thiamine biosynthesis lipoprotein
LIDAVEAALRAARLTGGDVDPTVGGALISLGYDRDFDSLVAGPRTTVASVPGWRTVRLDRHMQTIRVPRGVTLDLGATAKALGADRAVTAALAAAGCGVVVSLGGDVRVAGPPPADGWRIRVTDDHSAGVSAPGQWISLRSGGLATSSTTVRRWQLEHSPDHDGSDAPVVHHLLDPATGQPVPGPWRTVTVAAASCLDANIASTAAIVRGDRAPAWLERAGLPSRLVTTDGLVLRVAGWPAEGDDLRTIAAAGSTVHSPTTQVPA